MFFNQIFDIHKSPMFKLPFRFSPHLELFPTNSDHLKQCSPALPFIMLYKVALSFESVDEILKCDHSNESY